MTQAERFADALMVLSHMDAENMRGAVIELNKRHRAYSDPNYRKAVTKAICLAEIHLILYDYLSVAGT